MRAALPIVIWGGQNIHDEAFEVRLHHHCNPPLPPKTPATAKDEAVHPAPPSTGSLPSVAEHRHVALVGIHLCRRLSSRFVELTNSLGPELVQKAILAPCCLPCKGRYGARFCGRGSARI
jgi:hypothetical protein